MSTNEERALKAIWEHFSDGEDWGNALSVLTQYGREELASAQLKPSDLPEGGRVEIRNEHGLFAAYYFADGYRHVFDSTGLAETVEDAVREALEAAMGVQP